MIYKTQNSVIEAVQFTKENTLDILLFLGLNNPSSDGDISSEDEKYETEDIQYWPSSGILILRTYRESIPLGSYLIKDKDSIFYIPKDIFEQTFIEKIAGLSFYEAIMYLKKGSSIRRPKSKPLYLSKDKSGNNILVSMDTQNLVMYPYVPLVEDIMANDWEIC